MHGGTLRMAIPRELADELVSSGVAVPAFTTRSGAGQVLEVVIGTVNTAASVVTVVSSPLLVHELIERIRRLARARKQSKGVRVFVRVGTGTQTFDIDDEDDALRLAELLAAAITDATSEQPE